MDGGGAVDAMDGGGEQQIALCCYARQRSSSYEDTAVLRERPVYISCLMILLGFQSAVMSMYIAVNTWYCSFRHFGDLVVFVD